MMNNNATVLWPLYKELAYKIQNDELVDDKNGQLIAELIAPKVILDPSEIYVDFETRKSSREYIEAEKLWYDSQGLSIKSFKNIKTWIKAADKNGDVNSNYGNLVFSRNNFSQFFHALKSLIDHRDSRHAQIIYNRPSIHLEWNTIDASDFICTNFQHFFIRNNKPVCVTSMRSNDCIFGTFNDIPWFHTVINLMLKELKKGNPDFRDLALGDHIFIPNSFHAYQRQFSIVQKIAEEV